VTASSQELSFNSRPIVVQAGSPHAQLFYAYSNTLRVSSDFFRDQIPINGHKHEQVIKMAHAEPKVFLVYLHFLTHGKIPC